MITVVKSEILRVLKRRNLIIAFFLLIGFMLQGYYSYKNMGYVVREESAYVAYISTLSSNNAYIIGVLPLITCLIAADSLAWDRKTGYVRFMLTRSQRRDYILGKIAAVSVITAAVVLLGFLFSFVLAAVLYPLRLPSWHWVGNVATFTIPEAPADYVNPVPVFLHNLFFTHPFIYVMIITIIVTLAAVAYANVALLLSLWTSNIYLVLAVPWLLHVGLNFVFGVLAVITNKDFAAFSPIVLTGAFIDHGNDPGKIYVPIIWITTILLAATVTYVLFMKRRDILD
ncbi:MAG: hypothetical protein PWQ91_150 [Eubacteriales bacterium]|nr:hypothetical protein [Eubacteriales bacterium]